MAKVVSLDLNLAKAGKAVHVRYFPLPNRQRHRLWLEATGR